MEATFTNRIFLDAKPGIIDQVLKACTVTNPEYISQVSGAFSTWGISPKLALGERISPQKASLPRGYLAQLIKDFPEVKIIDHRATCPIEVVTSIQRRDYQKEFITTALQLTEGVLVAATGLGKTIKAFDMIHRLQ